MATMLTTVALWFVCFSAGVVLQRRVSDPQHLSHVLFRIVLWGAVPIVTFFAYTTITLDQGAVETLPVVIVASWTTLGLGVLWARLGSKEPRTQGLLALATALGNTANVGYPLAALVFGSQGLAAAVIYSEFQFLIPTIAVAIGVARRFAGPASRAPAALRFRDVLRSWIVNPPVAVGAVAVALRLAGIDLSDVVEPIGPYAGLAFGVLGFLQLGVAMPLKRLAHGRADVYRAAVTLALRCGAAPLVLYLAGRITGADIPGVYLLLAATPVAFNTMIVSRVFDLDAELARLLIVTSTPLVIAGVLIWQAL